MAGEGGKNRRNNLRGREGELAALLAVGTSLPAAAEALQVGLRTAERAAATEAVKGLVRRLRDERAEALVGLLLAAGPAAVKALVGLLDGDSIAGRLGAGRVLLQFTLQGLDAVEVRRRLAELEARFSHEQHPAAAAGLGADGRGDGEPGPAPGHPGPVAGGPDSSTAGDRA
jgi:hypothetical protein